MIDYGIGELASTIVSIGAVCTVLAAGFKFGWPRMRRGRAKFTAIVDSLAGRDEIRDPITDKVLAPALPGIGVRMAMQEEVSAQQAQTVARLAATVERLADQEAAITDLRERVGKLELAAVERVVGKAESTAAYHAIEAALNAEPPAGGEFIDEDPGED